MEEILALARDTSTPGPVLDRLAAHLFSSEPGPVQLPPAAQESLAAALARNPNISPSILCRLAELAPADFLENPALPLLRLEQPLWLTQCRHLGPVVALPQAPRWLLELALHRPHRGVNGLPFSLLKNPALPPDLAERLALTQVDGAMSRGWTREEAEPLPFHPNLDPEMGALLERLRPAWFALRSSWPIEGCPLSPEEAAFLAARGPGHARLLAPYEGVDLQLLMPWLDPIEPRVAAVVARCRALPLPVCHRLVAGFARELVQNPSCPPEILHQIAAQDCSGQRPG